MDQICEPASWAGRSPSSAPSAASSGAELGLAVGSPVPHPTPRPSPACQGERTLLWTRQLRQSVRGVAGRAVVIRIISWSDSRTGRQQDKASFIEIIFGFKENSSKHWIMLTSFEKWPRALFLTLWMGVCVLKRLLRADFWPRMPRVMRHPGFQFSPVMAKSCYAWVINFTTQTFSHIAIKWPPFFRC